MAKKTNREMITIPQEEFILKIAETNKIKCYYDIGASPGWDTWVTTNLLKKGNVNIMAFEPSREGYLKYKRLFGQYKKIKLFNIGLGDKAEVRNLKIISGRCQHATFLSNRLNRLIKIKRPPFIENNYTIMNQRARIESLDSFVSRKHLPIADIIKIDTEGWEYKIVVGARKLIKENLPVLLIELHDKTRRSFRKIKSLLHKLGYNHLTIFYLSSLCNRIYPYYIFYHLAEKEKIIKIFKQLSGTDFKKFYKGLKI